MKSKWKWILISVLALLAIAFLIVPAKKELVVRVRLPLERVMLEFEDTTHLVKWYAPYQSKAYAIEVEKSNPFTFIFLHQKDGKTNPLFFVVSPDTTDSKVTKIIFRYEASRLPIPRDDLSESAAQSLQRLEEWMGTTEYVYGHNIVMTTVTDSSFLFQTRVVASDQESAEAKKIFDELIAYAEKRNAHYNGVRIYYTQSPKKGQTAIYASIGVDTYTPTGPDENIQYKMMPYGKKLLVMDYEGPFAQTREMYRILEDYKRDNSLVSMAIPFQKFLSPGYGFADTQVVKTRISYPVF
jgi:hypothetical protein